MKVKIKRIDKSLPLPIYESAGAAGFDLLVRETTVVEAKEIALVPSNLIIAVPEGYMLMVASRSSTPRKTGLSLPHGIGIIDHDYCGPADEIKIQVYNFTDRTVTIPKGEKIAQGVFVKINRCDWEEVEEAAEKSRGGFGSTG